MTTTMTKKRLAWSALAAAAIVLLVIVLGASDAFARPGGGQSFSGGGGHSSGGGGSGGGGGAALVQIIYYLIELIITVPWLMIPLVGALIAYIIYSVYHQRANQAEWDSGPPTALEQTIDLGDLAVLDPEFSQVLFEDFAFRLFSTAHRARTTPAGLESIAPYVSPAAQRALASRQPDDGSPVEAVIVGAQRVYRLETPPSATDENGQPYTVRIGVEYEANVMVGDHTYYSVESWMFARDARSKSKPPGASKDFPCPNCGAPWQAKDTGTQVCASCGKAVNNGRFDWMVERITLKSMDVRAPSLTTEVPERGDDVPTQRAPDLGEQLAALVTADPTVTVAALQARLALIYTTLNAAWSDNQLEPARGLVSDGLYDYLEYWVKAYVSQHLRNQLIDMRLTQPIEIAKVVRDKWYDAVTVRIWATGKDLVVQAETGKVMRGSKTRERAYTEYWTIIRSAKRTGAPRAEPVCGNCGAPLAITMAGTCEHCNAHITAGEFDWVLSKIEQDDTYRA